MAALPSDLSLTNIPDGATIIAADHRNNYSAIEAGFNAVNDLLAGGTSGQVLVSGGPTAASWVSKDTIYRKTTPKEVDLTLTEQDLLNGEITVGAGAMGAVGVVRAHLQGNYLDNIGNTATLRLKFGSTTWWQGTFATTTSSTRRPWSLDLTIANLGATNAQDAHAKFSLSEGASPTTGLGSISATTVLNGELSASEGSLTVDTTSAQALQATCQLNTANGSVLMRLDYAIVTVTP